MSLDADYFERMYAADEDPWKFRDRWYERRKYALTMASLTRERYRSAFEPGCSIGVLTAELAQRCDRLLAIDPVQRAVEATRKATAGQPGVIARVGSLPGNWPSGTFDLIVLSEVGYYLGPADLRVLVDLAEEALEPGGDLVAVHWRVPVADYPATGDEVHDRLRAQPGLSRALCHEESDFLLEVFRRGVATSVAQDEGLR